MAGVQVNSDEFKKWGINALQALGTSQEDSIIVMDSLIYANMRGFNSHGAVRLIEYIDKIRHGTMSSAAKPEIIKDNPGAVLIDANNGFGQVAMSYGIEIGIKKAKSCGIAIVGIRQSNNFGVAGFLVEKVAAHGMIGMLMASSSPAMAPWGGTSPLLGTNPIAVCIPTANPPNIVLDMATSNAARGRIRLAEKKGESIPPDWAIDSEGNPTTNAAAALKGTVLPIAGPKGYGLALIIDIIAGLLTGSGFGGQVTPLFDVSKPSNFGQIIQVIDIDFFMPLKQFYCKVDELREIIHNAPTKPGSSIMLPGEPEHKRVQEWKGVLEIPEKIHTDFVAVCRNLNLEIYKYKHMWS